MHFMMAFFEKINLSSISYIILPGVATFSLLVEVTLLGERMACAMGFPYIISGTLYFIFLSHFFFPKKVYKSENILSSVTLHPCILLWI